MNRYIAVISLFVWAESDQEAKEKAEKICEGQRINEDNRAAIDKIFRANFGASLNEITEIKI